MFIMQRTIVIIATLLLVLLSSCKSEKKYVRYETLYGEAPKSIYITPLFDMMTRKSTADSALAASYARRDTLSRYFLKTLPQGLMQRGYLVTGGDSILRPGISSARRLSKLQKDTLSLLALSQGSDAILIPTLVGWKDNPIHPTVFLEYHLRSTKSGKDLMHCWVQVSREVDTTYKGEIMPLMDELWLADTLHTGLDCAIRCLMVERANLFVTQDLPFTPNSFYYKHDLYLYATNDYFKITFSNDGTMEVEPTTMEEYENSCFF